MKYYKRLVAVIILVVFCITVMIIEYFNRHWVSEILIQATPIPDINYVSYNSPPTTPKPVSPYQPNETKMENIDGVVYQVNVNPVPEKPKQIKLPDFTYWDQSESCCRKRRQRYR